MGTIVALLALACCAWASSHPSQDVKIFPLNKIETAREKMLKSGDLDSFNGYLNKQKALKMMAQDFDQSALELEAYIDASYAFDIGVGTPSQPFRVLFDLSIPWLWIPDIKCQNHGSPQLPCANYCIRKYMCPYNRCRGCPMCSRPPVDEIQVPPSGCEHKHKFDGSHSSSYGRINNDRTHFDASPNAIDKVEGFVGYDDVELFGIKSRQYIELATTVGDFMTQVDADGVLGCGFSQVEHKSGLVINPFLVNAYQQRHLGSDTIGIHMMPQGQSGISVGGANVQWYQPSTLHYHNVPSNSDHWTLNVEKFWLGPQAGANQFIQAGKAMLSTTVNYIGAPKTVVQKIAEAVGTLGYDKQMEMFKVLCYYPLQDIALFIDGAIYTLTAQDYVIYASNGQCYLGFKEISGGQEHYVLGRPFFNAYYVILEYRSRLSQPRIGLAKSVTA